MESVGEAAAGTARSGPPAHGSDGSGPGMLQAAIAAVARRMRAQHALDAGSLIALPALALAALALGLHKLGELDDVSATWALAAAGALIGIGLLAGALRRVRRLAVTRAIDRALGTPDLCGSAWDFARKPPVERTPFMRACINHAERESARVVPAQVFALHAPRTLPWAVAGALALLLLARYTPPAQLAAVVPKELAPRLLERDDLTAFAQDVKALRIEPQSDADVREAARELNALLEALADQSLDRTAALRELRGLEQRLQDAQVGRDIEAMNEALRELGRALAKDSPLTEPLAGALAQADAQKARAELERLAERVEHEALRDDAKERLARTLGRSERSATAAAARDRAEKAREEMARLLEKKREGQAAPEEREQRLLRDKQRELDRLEREAEQKTRGERELDQLRRELSSSAQSLGQGAARDAAQHMERGAQSLEQAQRAQQSAAQREQLRQRVEQLREQISKQREQRAGAPQKGGDAAPEARPGGDVQRLDLEHFSKAARGGAAPNSDQAERDGEPSRVLMPASGKDDGSAPRALVPSDGEPNGDQAGEQAGEQARMHEVETGRGAAPGRDGPGPRKQAETQLSGTRVDTRVSGEVGKGSSRSDVIREAGQRGFVDRDYERVHAEYERHADAVVERDHVPPGYRFYVRRYFQLIRPRQESP